jgi:hypothetical protein
MSAPADCATPPISAAAASTSASAPPLHLPPSPPLSPKPTVAASPRIDHLVRTVRLLRAGRILHLPDWHSLTLSPAEYEELERRVQEEGLSGYYHDKVRHDYDGERNYTLRMPSVTHEFFTASVADRVIAGVTDLALRIEEDADDGDEHASAAVKALRAIRKGGSPTLVLHAPAVENSSQESADAEKIVRRSPDATFYADGDALPAVVVEVGYSQQGKDLSRVADSYIIDSRHAIRCVIGLDITYEPATKEERKGKEATVSIWRPSVHVDEHGDEIGTCVCDVDASPFRTRDGTAGHGHLQLGLCDLLSPAVLDSLRPELRRLHMSIPFAVLAQDLAHAEQAAAAKPKDTLAGAPRRFRKRKRTPSEELSDDREGSFAKQEQEASQKACKVDPDWAVPALGRRRSMRPCEDTSDVAIAMVERRRRRSRRRTSGRSVADGD